MEGYISDKEQIQLIKDWWKKYGSAILFGIILVLGISFAWRYWHYYKNKRAEQASILYEQMLSSDMAQKTDDFKLFAKHLLKDYASTPYANLASLMLARQAVNADNLSEAQQDLKWVIENSVNKSFRQIARIRQSRVLLAVNQPQQALQILQYVDDKAFMPAINEARGDIFVTQNNKTKAIEEYKEALQSITQTSVMRPILEMKINQITK